MRKKTPNRIPHIPSAKREGAPVIRVLRHLSIRCLLSTYSATGTVQKVHEGQSQAQYACKSYEETPKVLVGRTQREDEDILKVLSDGLGVERLGISWVAPEQ